MRKTMNFYKSKIINNKVGQKKMKMSRKNKMGKKMRKMINNNNNHNLPK